MPRLPLPAVRHRSAVLAAGVLVLAVPACVEAPAQSGDVIDGPADGDAIGVVAVDNAFDPDVLEAAAGEEVTIEVSNEGEAAHNFVVSDLDISTGTLNGGDVATVTLTVPEGGVEYVCTFHGGMRGRITTT